MSVNVIISASVADLQAKFAVARAESNSLSAELNKLAREAAKSGTFDQLRPQLDVMAEKMLEAKNRATALSNELKSNLTPEMHSFGEAAGLAREALGALGLTASIGSVVEFGRSVLDAAIQVQHESEVLGLSTTAYQAFSESAKVAGVSTETVETSLRRFNAAQGEAQLGTGQQADAFRELGVSAKLSASEALPQVSRALLAITDPAQRARLEVVLFGRAGEELNPVLETWSTNVAELSRRMDELGLTSAPDVVESAKKVESAWSILGDRMAAEWTPAVVQESKGLELLSEWAYSAGNGIAYLAQQAFLPGLDHLRDVISSAQKVSLKGGILTDTESHTSGSGKAFAQGTAGGPSAEDERAAEQARRLADEQVNIWEQVSLKRIEGEQQANQALLALGQQTIPQFTALATRLEDARYQIQVGAAQARLAADKGNAQAMIRDQGDLDAAAVDHENRLAQIAAQGSEKQLEVARTQHSQLEALGMQYQHTAAAEAKRAVDEDIRQFREGEQAKIEAARTAAEEQMAATRAMYQELSSAESTFASQLLSGRVGAWGALELAGKQFLQQELTDDLRYFTMRALLGQEALAKDASLGQAGVLWHTIFESEKTAATTTGETVRAGLQAATAATENASLLGRVVKWIATELGITAAADAGDTERQAAQSATNFSAAEGNVAVAATAAAASQAGIPIIGPELAEVAAAGMVATLQPYVVMASLDTGTNYIPRTGLYQLHEGEAVTPARYNPAAGGAGSGGDTYIMNLNHSTNVDASTPIDLRRYAREAPSQFASAVMDLVRGGYLKFD